MYILETFVQNLCGEFNNDEQIKRQGESGKITHPHASHINGICNNKIKNLPENFKGYFVIEESYYEQSGRKNFLPHLFLLTLGKNNKVVLESYEIPETISHKDFRNNNQSLKMDYNKLKKSEKFNPMIYDEENGVFTGESVSMFSPITKFILKERIEDNILYISEVFYEDNKKTFGFEDPIIYKRAGNF